METRHASRTKPVTSVSILFAVLLIFCFSGRGEAKLNVVTTTTDIGSIAQFIGGDKVQVSSIAKGNQDPHFVEAKPSFMMKARKADLWVRVGLELEIGYEEPILDGSRNPRIRVGCDGHLDASEGVLRLEVPTQKVDRSMGDIHPLGNPHYWLDPYNGRIVARNIYQRLARLSPEDAEVFRSNYDLFCRELDEYMFGADLVSQIGGELLWRHTLAGDLNTFLQTRGLDGRLGGWVKTMEPYTGRKIVTYHRSWSYFAARFGLSVLDELEPKPGVPPSPGHVLEVIQRMKSEDVKIILMEPFYSLKAPDLVASKVGGEIVVCANSVGGEEVATDYITLIDHVVTKLAGALAGVSP